MLPEKIRSKNRNIGIVVFVEGKIKKHKFLLEKLA